MAVPMIMIPSMGVCMSMVTQNEEIERVDHYAY